MQPWRWEHPRVLIEHPDEATALDLAARLRRAGYSVATCPGPGASTPCPLTGAGECTVAHDADLVVSALGGEEVVAALRLRCPHVPVVVARPTDGADDLTAAVRGALDA